MAPARAARRELGLCEVAHEGAEDVEEALHFLCVAPRRRPRVTLSQVEMTNFGFLLQAF
jgi:hypothetical protein